MAAPAAVLSILVRANTGPATTALARINTQLGTTEKGSQRAAQAVGGLVKNLTLIGAVGTVGGLAYATKKAADFEAQLSSLGAVSDATGQEMERFRKQALKAGADTKFSALEAAAAQTELAKGGLTVRQIMRGGLRSALALAAAGEMELADAATATVNAMKLFGLRGKESMKVADAFATAANRTTADVADFAMALSQGGSAAKAAGLSFTETVAALEALAEVGIKNSDAGTSLKTALIQLASPTEKAAGVMDELGLNFFKTNGEMKSLVDISRMLRERMGGLTREQRLQASTTLVGTDGMRALLALYEAGPQKIQKFQEELGKQGSAAEVAAKKQDNLKGSMEQLRGSAETLAIKIGSALLPTLRDAADDLTEFTNKVGKIVDRKDLTVGEKLERIWDVAKVDFKPWVDKIGRAIDAANIPDKLGDALSAAVPVLAEAAGKAAVGAAKAFVQGFLAADVWGRVAIAGWLLARMGGPPAFLKMGTTAGTAMGTGIGQGAATGVAASGLKGKLTGLFRSWGPTLGVALAATLGPEVVKAVEKGTVDPRSQEFDLPRYMREPIGAVIKPLGDLEAKIQTLFGQGTKLQDFGEKAEETFKKLSKAKDVEGLWQLTDQARALARQFPEARDELNRFADATEDAATRAEAAAAKTRAAFGKEWIGQIRDNWKQLGTLARPSLQQIRDEVQRNGQIIKDRLGKDTDEGRKAMAKNFRLAAKAIRERMEEGSLSTKTGTEKIRGYLLEALMSLGLNEAQARSKLTRGTIQPGARQPGMALERQRGGPISVGAPSGDSVPAVLERGEYVLNRKAVAKVGRRALDRLNFAAAPRFQSGGIVELLHPFNDPKGHGGANSHLHIAAATMDAIVALGKRLRKLGWLVGEHPAFGGIQGRHAPGGYHYTGQAIDVNWPDAGAEAAKIRALLPMLGAGAGGLLQVPTIPGLTTNMPGAPGALVNRALGVTRSTAQAVLESVVGGIEGAETSLTQGGFGKAQLKRLWTQAGGDPKVANLMAAIALAESGGNPAARNPSGASGLWQILGLPFQGDPFDPATNARMAVAKYKSQGLGAWEAYTRGMHRQFLQGGGMAGVLGKGFRQLRRASGGRARGQIVRGLMDKIKDIGLPDGLQKDLKRLENDAAVFADMADRASALTSEDADGNAILGVVGGKTEAEWVQAQLQALFEWRNAIIRAEEIVAQKRAEVAELIERARARLANIVEEIRAGVLSRRPVQKALDEAERKPKKNRKLIRTLRDQLRDMDGAQKKRIGLRDSLKTIIGDQSSGLIGKRAALVDARGGLLETLQTIQGVGSPMEVLATLPAPGVLGGSILDAQLRFQDLTAERPKITDTTAAAEVSERESLLEQLLRESRLRTAVSEAHFKVFRDFPTYMGAFAKGGVALVGERGPELAHMPSGTRIHSATDTQAMLQPNVTVIVYEGEGRAEVYIDDRRIESAVERVNRRAGRVAGRGLPGAGGGLTRG